MYLIQLAIEYGAPLFLISSPLTSYLDQILSIHRNRSSVGFSLDIPLIMLVASILKVFYWFGEYYSKALLAQAVVMILVQMALLKVALDNRPAIGAKNGIEHTPFSGGSQGGFSRPYDFWQWKNTKPFLGAVGLAVEATLPLPQILANYRSGSCKGFRVSVLAAWILGDTMKMSYFFCSQEAIPWAFKLCGMFQCVCDLYLGFQYWMFTRASGRDAGSSVEHEGRWGQEEKDIRMN
ncbi:uncharacterized protein N7473_003606 [Penicillium subrubescens]|uniref:uncharacterized protein n=1 Tax=Penicillium subrubescens TaxID=1316194 RepID=UPI0025450299|nr:uncharacterized protein N7473_003606 [Penicillium subrubescens]KAJ5906690.1 hypothetical protein N7473_003606 [Penicillium subrubescens]